MASIELGESQRALLHYFAGIVTQRQEARVPRRECELLLVQGRSQEEIAPPQPWHKVWEGARPGDRDERYRLYWRSAAPVKP